MKLTIPKELRIYVNAPVETGVLGLTPEEVLTYALHKFIAGWRLARDD